MPTMVNGFCDAMERVTGAGDACTAGTEVATRTGLRVVTACNLCIKGASFRLGLDDRQDS